MGFILNYDFGHLSGQQRGIVTSCDGSCSGRAGRVDHVDIWTDFPTILGGRPFAWGKCSSEIRLNTSQAQFGKGKCPFLANGLLQILIPYFLVPVGTSRKSLWHDDTPSSTITKFNSPHLNAFFLGGVPPLKNHFKKTPPKLKINPRKSASKTLRQLMAASWASKPWKELVELVSATHQQVQERLWRGWEKVGCYGVWWFQAFGAKQVELLQYRCVVNIVICLYTSCLFLLRFFFYIFFLKLH